MASNFWIGVDLDGTLAEYDSWKGPEHIGKPIEPMVKRIKAWLEEGREVRIFTARVNPNHEGFIKSSNAIIKWCKEVFGQPLVVTCCKDMGMIELWDDRCVAVKENEGIALSPSRVK